VSVAFLDLLGDISSKPIPRGDLPLNPWSQTTIEEKQQKIRHWTERLYQDYDHILFTYSIRMSRPQIRVQEVDSMWGQWNPTTRTITLSQKLIEMHSWDVVLEILKHEMAHQMVLEVLGYHEQHGPHFRRACTALGVADWAQTATGEIPKEIPHWKDHPRSPEEDRLIKRVEKLLALAESTNEHEAAIAMERVREIYARHNIDRVAKQNPSSMIHCVITRRKKKTESCESLIFSILNEHFFVRSIHTSIFDAEACEEYKAVELLGTRENVVIAEYVYHFLWNTLQDLWKAYQKNSKKKDARAKRSYMLGVLSGFRDKLNKGTKTNTTHPDRTPTECYALIAQGHAELSQFVGYRYPKLSKRSWSAGHAERSSFEAGKAEGANLNLRRGLHHTAGNLGKLLT
jgi:predicted SprT family Zn-dependent metalloprotease